MAEWQKLQGEEDASLSGKSGKQSRETVKVKAAGTETLQTLDGLSGPGISLGLCRCDAELCFQNAVCYCFCVCGLDGPTETVSFA